MLTAVLVDHLLLVTGLAFKQSVEICEGRHYFSQSS
jgi:hypothetical protein